jgi:hypothetical protein
LLNAHATRARCSTDFREALEIQRCVEAMQESSRGRSWVKVASIR